MATFVIVPFYRLYTAMKMLVFAESAEKEIEENLEAEGDIEGPSAIMASPGKARESPRGAGDKQLLASISQASL